ncbi:helix-turn-helix transcriptional regulator [Rhizobium sp. Pop5]|uniref:helix-turn-helix transcriptional regulator n=1 Tax=Rhizobium sp. Pop5 TaxID=1223565 RepID=UPI0002837D60|nr:helix-turn-helix transcriptional regulator [Rhizobium sp. Pop5]EJZ17461.1 LuxR family transcriptional regulator [Rhizobium sp. Pop5]UVD58898.1 helix-turn-helix transcriptional regulator [Rhizobium sp. Pop5]
MEQQLSEIIGSIYDCVAREDAWPNALRLINRQVNGFLTTLAVFDTTTRSARLAQIACDDAEAVRALVAHAKDVPFFHLLHRMEIDQPDTLERMFSLYGADGETVWKSGALYQNFHARYGVLNSIDMAVLKRPTRVGTINISVQYEPSERRVFDIVGLLGPHIRRAVTIHDMFEMERAEAAVLREVIDALEHAVFIVAEDMTILFANDAAEARLREQEVVHALSGRLATRYAYAGAALSNAVALGARDEISLAAAGIDVPLASAERPAVAHVLPLQRRAEKGRFESRAAAAIFLAAAGTVIQSAVEAIAALFALTPAERRVVGYVSEGMTRSEIANAQGVADGTVKSQLAAIYDKTGAEDQRSLQQLVRDLSPPVRRP